MMLLGAAHLVLAGVLGWAAAGKLRDRGRFADQLAAYRILPGALSRAAAPAVIGAEMAAALLLLVPAGRPLGAPLATLLLAAFSVALLSAWRRGLEIGCACFGGSGELETVGLPTVSRTLLLLLLAGAADLTVREPFTPVQLLLAPLLAAGVGLLSELTRLLAPPPSPAGDPR